MSLYEFDPNYRIPIFADGTVRFSIKQDGKTVFSIATLVRGETRQEQEENLMESRVKIQKLVDLANTGLQVSR
jgi:hypothetical protein